MAVVQYGCLAGFVLFIYRKEAVPALVLFFCANFAYALWRTRRSCVGRIGRYPHYRVFNIASWLAVSSICFYRQSDVSIWFIMSLWAISVCTACLELHMSRSYRWNGIGLLVLAMPQFLCVFASPDEELFELASDEKYDNKPASLTKFLSKNSVISDAARSSETLRHLLKLAHRSFLYKSSRIVHTTLTTSAGRVSFEDGTILLEKGLSAKQVPIIFAHELAHLISTQKFSLFKSWHPLSLGDYMTVWLKNEANSYYFETLVQRELGYPECATVYYSDEAGEPKFFKLGTLVTNDETESLEALFRFLRDRHILSGAHMRSYPPWYPFYKEKYLKFFVAHWLTLLGFFIHHWVDEALCAVTGRR